MEDWDQVPPSKNGIWGHFSACVHIPSFRHVKLHMSTKFHAGIVVCTIVTNIFANRPDYQLPVE